MVDVRLIREILETAGGLAMRHFLKVTPSRKADRSFVTEADLAVQAFLLKELDARFPEDGIVAEENNLRKEPTAGDRYWIIDPIDGTTPFVAGLPGWGIALGLMEGGQPVAGFFKMPASGDFFHTTPEEAACRNGRSYQMKPPQALHPDTMLLTHARPHKRYTLSPDYPGRVFNVGSAAAHLCYVATGGADAVLIGHDKIWDLAAGVALLLKNGGELRYFKGPAVSLAELLAGTPAPHPMLGGHPEVIAQFEDFIDYHSPRFF